ncbi:uncharacterized protein LOC119654204 isoform X2 [Hermetia illucens]|uniref:uncharacterized protein LOC119654204 isoform X2 n=1 Tax=Hermetia illucens TaxID=343691 RepID=UPI0018CC794E|nr:uncharacterized protein LOC119654204 isoform X2 [Hermetia illucens]
MRNTPATTHQMDPPGIGPKKTFFVLMTVVGCIAILWPKVFYPMMMGSGTPKQPALKGHHGTVSCCDVVLDRDNFLNLSKSLGDQAYRKQLDYRIAQMSLRQERPPHLRKEGVHPAMLEKGRAIPSTQTVPVVSRPTKSAPIMVEGRPGPIPGLRPPLGAGSVHKAQPKSNSMSFIMPLYTIGIIAFFVYTIMKLLFKKPVVNSPYGPARGDPNFRKEVFGQDQLHINRPDDGTTKLGTNHQQMHASCNCDQMHVNGAISSSTSNKQHRHHSLAETEQETINNNRASDNSSIKQSNGKVVRDRDQLMEIEKLRKKLEDTEQAMAKLIAEMGCDPYKAKDETEHTSATSNLANGHTKPESNGDLEKTDDEKAAKPSENQELAEESNETLDPVDQVENENDGKGQIDASKPEHHQERTVQVLGMELTASCEGGQKWARPPTPIFSHRPQSPVEEESEKAESIFLEGALPRESQILVADSETRTENVVDEHLNGSPDEPAVVLSSKMTLSLINLNSGEEQENASTENDSPIGEDIEIINGAEKESNDTDESDQKESDEAKKVN